MENEVLMIHKLFRSAVFTLHPRRLAPILIVSLISGLVVTTYQISFGSLIFSGELAGYVSTGIGFCLMGVVIIASMEAILSGNPGMVAIPTVGSAVIVATIAANITRLLAAAPHRIFPTVVAGITIASIITGGVFILLGWMRLGNLIRFIPHPVIGGFLAGTGWLVFQGALKVMNGISLDWDTVVQYVHTDALLRWLPGMALGVIMLFLSRRYKHYLVTPVIILASIGLFYLVLQLTQTTIPQAIQLGLLFEPFSSGSLWKPPPLNELAVVDWQAIIGQTGEIATLILISSITILLYASGIEVTAGVEVDLNQELRACGVGNLLAGMSASIPGYTIITMSVLSYKLGARSRLVGILVAAFCAGMLFFGAGLIALFPKPVLGGIATYLGLSFLFDWVVLGFRKLSRLDYLIVIFILFTMGFFGLLAGLGTGIALAAGLFIFQYSQVPIVRHVLDGTSYHSRVTRTYPDSEVVSQKGNALLIMELQGFIFFGTANRVVENIKERLQKAAARAIQVILLDFRQVSGVDVSAALSFVRLKRLLRQHHIMLIFSHLKKPVEQILRSEVLTPEDQGHWQIVPDLDHGIEWFEERILEHEVDLQERIEAIPGAVRPGIKGGGLAMLFAALGEEARAVVDPVTADEALLSLMETLEPSEIAPGEIIIRQNDPQQKLYFLDSGQLTIEYTTSDALHPIRLETGGPGTIVGEIGLYLGTPASATVIAAQTGMIYCLSSDHLEMLERNSAITAAILHRFLLKRVAQRLLSALATVDMLMK
jgi:sulfate permease, SulP family